MLSKISSTEKHKSYDITYKWKQKKYNKLLNMTKNEADTDIEKKLVVTTNGEREGGRAI